jgi:hypothetical protein
MDQQMNTWQAMEILKQACAVYVGTLADHSKIQTALAVVGTIVCPSVDASESKPE